MDYLIFKQSEDKAKMSKDSQMLQKSQDGVKPKHFQSSAQKKSKRFRSAFSTEQINYLEQEFRKFPYIGSGNRKDLANKLNITERAVKIWFQNRRMREKRDGSGKEYYTDDQMKDNSPITKDTFNNVCNLSLNNEQRCPNGVVRPNTSIFPKELIAAIPKCKNKEINEKVCSTPNQENPKQCIRPNKGNENSIIRKYFQVSNTPVLVQKRCCSGEIMAPRMNKLLRDTLTKTTSCTDKNIKEKRCEPNEKLKKYVRAAINDDNNHIVANEIPVSAQKRLFDEMMRASTRTLPQDLFTNISKHNDSTMNQTPCVSIRDKPNEYGQTSSNSESVVEGKHFHGNKIVIPEQKLNDNVKRNCTEKKIKKKVSVSNPTYPENLSDARAKKHYSSSDQEVAQDLSRGKFPSNQTRFYPFAPISNSSVLLHTQNSYLPPPLPPGNIIWKPISAMQSMSGLTAPLAMTISEPNPGLNIGNENILKDCSCTCNCISVPIQSFAEVSRRSHPQYILAIPLSK